jgi:hypothetical protein
MIGGTVYSGQLAFVGVDTAAVAGTSGVTAQLVSNNNGRNGLVIGAGSTTVTIQAVKLEIGTVSTLAYDPPVNYGLELIKCSRHYGITGISSTVNWDVYNLYNAFVSFPVAARLSSPSVQVYGGMGAKTAGKVSQWNGSAWEDIPAIVTATALGAIVSSNASFRSTQSVARFFVIQNSEL